ncbi:hypothetical protein Q669_24165 [Labrenzia sp. C1B10]|uniref:hypothetical protein n=1 Tax=unclassified Labrenzia TaxID=2648686 RepID=UPI0003B8B94B|nr:MULTISPECIES: hypothetical protein [unclassified Labrenzia]ERP98291.1 hypothetical protein Q669_24165 [Labrenzia sp. C1B10]ERS02083.1 hypothetical protein Q675_08280 [Labrenzia sp. C1B70]
MGTFFKSRAVKSIYFTNGDFIETNEQSVVPQRDSILANWFEFTRSVGIDSTISVKEREYFITTKIVSNHTTDYPLEIFKAIYETARIINSIYSVLMNINRNPSRNANNKLFGFDEIPIINHEELRAFGAKNFSQADLVGTFLVELKDEIPSFVDNLQLPVRQIFEKGVESYRRYVEDQATERFKAAQRKTVQAIEIEDEAEKITKSAFQKTDAALGAEATAEGMVRLTQHWQEKAAFHQNRRNFSFWGFAIVLVLALVLLFLSQTGMLRATFHHWCDGSPYCPSWWQQYLSDLSLVARANGNWLMALLSLKGVLIPILGVAWLLRILSRQSQSHFALENDARQRLALLVSFVRLQEIPDQELTDAERLMILTELFRPIDAPSLLDGPPNLAELIGKVKP